MKRRGWISCAAAAVITAAALTGCGSPQFISGVDTLLRPPRLTDDQNDIYNALTSSLSGKEMHLVYPQKGDYLSAFIRYDLDCDGSEEALVFYQLSASLAASPVSMAMLDFRDGRWAVVSDVQLDGSGVEDVSFLSVENEPLAAVGLSYGGDSGSSFLQLFSCEGDTLTRLFSRSYQAKAIGDMTGDGNSDLLLIYSQEDSEGVQSVNAGLFVYQKSQEEPFTLSGSCTVNPEITRYQQIAQSPFIGKSDVYKTRLYLDGYRGNVMITEELLLTTENDTTQVQNITWNELDGGVDYPERMSLVSMDIDGDGRMEIPGQVPLPGYTAESSEILYQTTWYRHIGSRYLPIYTGYVGAQLGYMFRFPDKWEGKITAYRGSSNQEVTFSVYQEGVPLEDTAVLSIRAVSAASWRSGKNISDYEYLMSRGQVVFLVRILDRESKYALTMDDIRENFIDLDG